MANVHAQLINALRNQGVQVFGDAGDLFDATIHEVLKEIDTDDKPGTIVKVVRRGYNLGDRVIRPAQVVITTERS